jgi:hypothetical protein
VAIDGKTLRGAHPPNGHSRPIHLLAAMEHTRRVVLAASGMLAVAAGNPARPAQALVTAALWRRDRRLPSGRGVDDAGVRAVPARADLDLQAGTETS